jgi:hypothetical protein
MMMLLLLVLFGIGTCVQNTVDVNVALTATDLLKKMKAAEEMEAAEKGSGKTSADTGLTLAQCQFLFPSSLAGSLGWNVGTCRGMGKCELRGKINTGDSAEFSGAILFPCANCNCVPNGGRLTITRSFTWLEQTVSLGPLGSIQIRFGGDVGITVQLTYESSMDKLFHKICLNGAFVLGVGKAVPSGTKWTADVGARTDMYGCLWLLTCRTSSCAPMVYGTITTCFGIKVLGWNIRLCVVWYNQDGWVVDIPCIGCELEAALQAGMAYVDYGVSMAGDAAYVASDTINHGVSVVGDVISGGYDVVTGQRRRRRRRRRRGTSFRLAEEEVKNDPVEQE